MVFSSPIFLFAFLPVVLFGSLLFSGSRQNAFLLVASLIFYCWGETTHGWLLGVSILFNYFAGIELGRGPRLRSRLVLVIAITVNLALLGWFKYAAFLAKNLGDVLVAFGAPPSRPLVVHLPIGISFYTF